MADSQLRRTLLFVPGNMPSMLQNVPLFKCDSVIIDLEDAVNHAEKDAARNLVRRFLESWKERDKEVLVRINPLYTKWGRDDLKAILPQMPDAIRFPMCETAEMALELDAELGKYESANGLEAGHFGILPSIETVKSVLNAYAIATSTKRIFGLAFGAEDYTASMGIARTNAGEDLIHPRMMVVMAAKAAGLQAIDSIFSDINDMEALRKETELVKRLGYTGKCLVNPRQIDIIHEVFAPKQEEIDYAQEVVEAIKQAQEMGTGVISLRGKMVDAPIVKRAIGTLRIAYAQGLVDTPVDEEILNG
ncbi:MAG: CoA ester lyase [Candidatus Accumulibacter sp.]|jgi:citrate lyase subunit beta/citryl-CoA lyase|nr:CoA ester lyase [Accumulibacter sp.]